jgi:multidrug resistance efflux pump
VIRLDDDQEQADVKVKKANLEELKAELQELEAEPRQRKIAEAQADLERAQVATEETRRRLDKLEPLVSEGALPENTYREARASSAKAEKEERAAQQRLEALRHQPIPARVAELKAKITAAEGALELAEANLDDLTITARVAGVVSRLEAIPGLVIRPGTAIWGEIIDLSVLDVRCPVTPEQARRIKVGQGAEVREDGQVVGSGRVVFVDVAGDEKTGRVRVLVRLDNPEERLRCYVPVEVVFPGAAGR